MPSVRGAQRIAIPPRPIDAAGQLVDGTHVNSPAELRRALAANPEQFVQTLTEKLLMYSLGRTVEYHDMPLVRKIVRDAARDGYRFSAIVKGIVESAAFQQVQISGSAKARELKEETMFITKKHIPRRTFLRGIGAAVALPLLDSMIPASTALAQTAAGPKLRMGFIYFPHGAIMDQWTPTTAGKDFKISPILQPLEPYRKQLTIVSGLDNKPATLPPVHALNPGTWLSCVSPRKTQEPFAATTVDQLAAQRLGQDTPFPSLEVATESRGGNGTCDRNYGCSYSGTISFRDPSTPLPMEANPRNLFQRLFGQGDTPEERARLGKQYASILDVISQESAGLKRRVGAEDRVMLDEYLETIREIERRVQKMEQSDLSKLDLPDAPGRYSQLLRRAPQPDVRSRCARVPGKPHTGLLHDDGRRRSATRPTTTSAWPTLSIRCRIIRTIGRRWTDSSKFRRTTAAPSPSSWPSWRRCRTAMATCWITRSFSTAATCRTAMPTMSFHCPQRLSAEGTAGSKAISTS
jgi:hypothetical protein